MSKYEYETFDGEHEPLLPSRWTVQLIGKEELLADSLSEALITLGSLVRKHGAEVLQLEVNNEERIIKAFLELRKWFIVRLLGDGYARYADGFYGWDGSVYLPDQIFSEEDLPYAPEARDIESIFICESLYKPSVEEVNNFLKKR